MYIDILIFSIFKKLIIHTISGINHVYEYCRAIYYFKYFKLFNSKESKSNISTKYICVIKYQQEF